MALNRELIGKKYRGDATFVKTDDVERYAEATDDMYSKEVGKEAIAPPLFAVKPLLPVVLDAVLDPELNANVMRLVHGTQDMYFHQPLRIWDIATPRAEITDIRETSSGEILEIHQRVMVDGQPAVEVVAELYIRGKKTNVEKPKEPSSEEQHDILFEEEHAVQSDHPARYAEASGDRNPIHIDEDFAKMSGFPSVILHGLCTMAFAGQAIIKHICEGDSRRLKRLKVRFSKPVLPGGTLTTQIWKGEEQNVFRFRVVNQKNEEVIKGGVAEVI